MNRIRFIFLASLMAILAFISYSSTAFAKNEVDYINYSGIDVDKVEDTYIDEVYQDYIYRVSEQYSLCPELVIAIIERESAGRADVSNGDCIGLMQVSNSCHLNRMQKLGGTSLYDPYTNILVGCDLLYSLFEEYEDLGTVLMLYNGTKGAAKRGEMADYTAYAKSVMKRSYELEAKHGKLEYEYNPTMEHVDLSEFIEDNSRKIKGVTK